TMQACATETEVGIDQAHLDRHRCGRDHLAIKVEVPGLDCIYRGLRERAICDLTHLDRDRIDLAINADEEPHNHLTGDVGRPHHLWIAWLRVGAVPAQPHTRGAPAIAVETHVDPGPLTAHFLGVEWGD